VDFIVLAMHFTMADIPSLTRIGLRISDLRIVLVGLGISDAG
jgi:hypothetical protein